MGQRTYRSPLREEHTRRTREVILDALVEIAGEGPIADLNIADLATRAGVATRTVYRHFPDRPALLDGLAEHLAQRGTWPIQASSITSLEELVDAIPASIEQYEERPDETRALVALNVAGEAAMSRENASSVRQLVAAAGAGVHHDDIDGVSAILHLLASSRTWVRLRDEVGLDADQARRAIAWATRTLVDDLTSET